MTHGVPSAAELLEAVAEFLREELLPELSGSQAFNTRVALHVLGSVERELRIEIVKDFARGCMRNYLILKDKAKVWNADKEIQSILKKVSSNGNGAPKIGSYSKKTAAALLAHSFDKDGIMKKRLPYERLDQLTGEILTGAR